jgi:adenylyltransferase/sulfurtransferase
LRAFAEGQREIRAEGATVGEAIANFASLYPDIETHIYGEGGEPRSFINIFLGEVNVKNLNGLETTLADGSVITLVPAIAGGAPCR